MQQNVWKPEPIRKKGGQRARRRPCWSKFLWYPVLTLGVLIMVLAFRLGSGHALAGQAWQKAGPAAGFTLYSAALAPEGDKPLATLTSDNDDDDDGDGDDCPTTVT